MKRRVGRRVTKSRVEKVGVLLACEVYSFHERVGSLSLGSVMDGKIQIRTGEFRGVQWATKRSSMIFRRRYAKAK